MNKEEHCVRINKDLDAIILNISDDDLTIKIKYLDQSIPRIEKIVVGDWIDLYAAETIVIPKNTMKLVNLGIAMELPAGYEAYLLPRSSTFKHWGCIQTNSCGVIDESYCGDNDYWKMPLYCLNPNQGDTLHMNGDESTLFKFLAKYKFGHWILRHLSNENYENHKVTIIKKGEKIAQFRIIKHMPTVNFKEVEFLNNKNRGGFGSTGK